MTEHFTEKTFGNRKHRPKARQWQTEARTYCSGHVTAVDELVLSQEDQTQTHL